MYLYSILLICSISVPFALSFDKKLQFYRQWKFLFPSILLVAIFYIICDIYLTRIGVWGFNPLYHLNILISGLPIEEWLFFLVIPYASIFLHDAFVLYFPKIKANGKFAKMLSIAIILISVVIILFHFNKTYTVYSLILLLIALTFSLFDKSMEISNFYITFLLILIPFLIVNAILTGSFIDQEVVWYNNSENLGIRLFTIPVEDFAYGFSMIFFSLLIRNKLKLFVNKTLYNHVQ